VSTSPYLGCTIETTVNTEAALVALKAAMVSALADVFHNSIVPDAKANCPVGTDPIEPGSSRNRDSITAAVWVTRKGPFAKLFTESGHGGYVEVGTVHMTGQPYAWPAVQKFIPVIIQQIKLRVSLTTSPVVGLGRVIVE